MSLFSRVKGFVTNLFRREPEPQVTKSPEESTFEELLPRAIPAGSLLDKPNINNYLVGYEPEWLEAWENAPVEQMTGGQLRSFIDILTDMPIEDWPNFTGSGFEYWNWWREEYSTDDAMA